MKPGNDEHGFGTLVFIDKKFLLVISVIVLVMILDVALISTYGIIHKHFTSNDLRKVVFSIESTVILITAFFLLSRIRPLVFAAKLEGKLNLSRLHRLTQIVYYVLAGVMMSILLQLFLNSYYSTILLTEAIILSYGIAIAILSIFLLRMAQALSTGRNIVIIVFLATLGTITFNLAVTMVDISFRISDWATEIRYVVATGDVSKGRYDTLDDLYFASYIASFVTAWGASVVMLSYYARKMGRIKVWALASAPLIFFLLQFAPLYSTLFSSLIRGDAFFFSYLATTISSLSKPVGGLMLAIVFWSMAKAKETNASLKKTLIIGGFGFLLLFTSNQALLMSIIPFPPFGLPSIAIIGLSAYLLVIGVYASAIGVSTDTELRKSIRSHTESRLSLLQSVISQDMIREIEKESAEIVRKESRRIARETGIDTNLDEVEMKAYLDEVSRVVRERKMQLTDGASRGSRD